MINEWAGKLGATLYFLMLVAYLCIVVICGMIITVVTTLSDIVHQIRVDYQASRKYIQ